MMALVAALLGALTLGGVVLLIVSFRPAPPPRNRPRRGAKVSPWNRFSRRTKITLALGIIAGFAGAAISGIIVLAVVVPIAFVGLPLLLGKQDTRERDLLSALETWSRSLASTADTGSFTLREVIAVTRASAPPILRVAVDRLHNRMNGSWSNAAALRAFADEMDNAWADEVVIYLIQAAEFNAGGLTRALESLADNLADQVKQRIEIYSERDKPRRALVSLTGIVGFVVVGIVLFGRTPQLAAYSTPLGQMVLMLILSFFVALLAWAKSQTRSKPESRIITNFATEVQP
jgi:tight adherence protein B